jgi:hypothetical protein
MLENYLKKVDPQWFNGAKITAQNADIYLKISRERKIPLQLSLMNVVDISKKTIAGLV